MSAKAVHTEVTSGTTEYRTGEHCPVSGWWAPSNRKAAVQFVAEGSIMPVGSGMAVVWTLVKTSPSSIKTSSCSWGC
ncbi:hypothetical protein D7003_07450 [Arthrobacter oryzae]|uniref:Uncharacterized protein n=1 Tax=Arthrobacter oryzae TaxID=409290 RepID=A0A3N0C3J7_9MICC|nr:hypothetical protein D7003_07450 [Arthrobacter oryzae]